MPLCIKIKVSGQGNHLPYHSFFKLVSLFSLYLRMLPDQFKFCFTNIGSTWKNLAQEVLMAEKYSVLRQDNSLSYTQKLEKKYSKDLFVATQSGVLQQSLKWLEV